MSVITHSMIPGAVKALCGEKFSMTKFADVWHILLTAKDFNNDEITQGTRCAECADIQAARENGNRSAKIALNQLYGKPHPLKSEVVHKADLKAAFKIVEERNREIATLRQDILHLERKLKRTEDSLEGATDAGSAMINEIAKLSQDNTRLENELHYAKAEIAPIVRAANTLAFSSETLMESLTEFESIAKVAREKMKEMDK